MFPGPSYSSTYPNQGLPAKQLTSAAWHLFGWWEWGGGRVTSNGCCREIAMCIRLKDGCTRSGSYEVER